MCKFKVGDEVVLVNSKNNPSILKNGVSGIVLDKSTVPNIQFNIEKHDGLHDAAGLGEDGKCWSVEENEIELLKPQKTLNFKTSNRYKLHKYLLSTGFTKYRLGLMIGKSKEYFSNETKESRFTQRGDMSDARYKALRKQVKEAVSKTLPVKINTQPASAEQNKITASGFKFFIDGKEVKTHSNEGEIQNLNIEGTMDIEFSCGSKHKSNDLEIFLAVVLVSLLIFVFGYLIYVEM